MGFLDESSILALNKRFFLAKKGSFLTLNQSKLCIERGWLSGSHIVPLIHNLGFCKRSSRDLPLGFTKSGSTLTRLVYNTGILPKTALCVRDIHPKIFA